MTRPDLRAEPGALAARFLHVVEKDILPLTRSVAEFAAEAPDDLRATIEERTASFAALYTDLSDRYQAQKGGAGIPPR